jgi:pimeloyl-ACP methyl ester carboxylesterase
MTQDLLFDGAHLRAKLYDADAAKLMVTFDFRQIGKTGFGDFPPKSGNFARNGFGHLCIKTRINDWFINDDTETLDRLLAALAPRYAQVNVMGFSMGGYGAFRFAKVLGAAGIVSVSPQFSIHPEAVPFDNRYRSEAGNFDLLMGDLGSRGMDKLPGVIVVDPFKSHDLRNARMIQAAFPEVRLARVAFGGHPATKVLRDMGKIGPVQREAQSLLPDPAPIVRQHRQCRSGSDFYWLQLARWATGRRPGLATFARERMQALKAVPRDGSGNED